MKIVLWLSFCVFTLKLTASAKFRSESNLAQPNPEVNTTSGLIVGLSHPESHAFYSIPYAQPPIENLRFQPPLPLQHQGRLDCSTPNYRRCYGAPLKCSTEAQCARYSEDCLVLNIHVPSTVDLNALRSPTDLLPVMFWIHGGGFSYGSGTEPLFDSQLLSNATNTIVVSINYRLNALGFLYYEENGESFEGNQGIKDQQLALQWVRDNIAKFGGDRYQVTVFGESAGAQSITLHLMSEKSKPLFQRAIIQSSPTAYHYLDKPGALKIARSLLSNLTCTGSGIKCLRDTSPVALMKSHFAVAGMQSNYVDSEEPYRPLIDGVEFSQQPLDFFFRMGGHIGKDVILGTTSDEMAFIKIMFEGEKVTKEMFKTETNKYVGETSGPIVAQRYIESIGASANDSEYDYTNLLSKEVTDMFFVCPNRALARSLSPKLKTSNAKTYLYVFDYLVDAENCEEVYGFFSTLFCNYASHSSELPYIFNSGHQTGLRLRRNGKRVANMMKKFWGNFARSGKPTDDVTVWPPYVESILNGSIAPWTNIRIRPPRSNLESEYQRSMCDFWDSTGFYLNMTSSLPTPANVIATTSSSSHLEANKKCVAFSAFFLFFFFFTTNILKL